MLSLFVIPSRCSCGEESLPGPSVHRIEERTTSESSTIPASRDRAK